MPWQARSVIVMREEFVNLAINGEISFSELCRRFNISRRVGYKWLFRYEAGGNDCLLDKSRAPNNPNKKISVEVEKAVVELRLKHRCWGGRKIRHYLLNKGLIDVPASSTITDILHRHNLINAELSKQQRHWTRFEHESPNDLWQMDYKGHFAVANGKRCYPLTIIDDHSRFAIAIAACQSERGEELKIKLIEIFEQYGLPYRINVDNGNPWGSIFELCKYTSFGLWLLDIGIRLSHSRPHHPQTNGKNERFNRSLKQEVITDSYFKNLEHAQVKFDDWRAIYNLERPHEAIGYKTPCELYKPSYRSYKGVVEEYEYSSDYQVKIVDTRGRINIEGRAIFIGVPFARKEIGLRYVKDNDEDNSEQQFCVYYRQQELGKFNLNSINKGYCVNLYSIVK